MSNEFGLKEFYDVELKTTYPIEVNGRKFEPYETLVFFDKIQLANFKEIQEHVAARGGYNNEGRVFWDTTKELKLSFKQGVFSKEQFSFMNNAYLLEKPENEKVIISFWEKIESDERGDFQLKRIPHTKLFVYDAKTGKRINYTKRTDLIYRIPTPYKELRINYDYCYNNGVGKLMVGKKATTGFLTLEGRTRIQEDKTGLMKTGIIKIPKLKLVSDLSIRLGQEANPVTDFLDAVAYPTGERGNARVLELYFLDDDIDSDF